jgi:hypothetical protein
MANRSQQHELSSALQRYTSQLYSLETWESFCAVLRLSYILGLPPLVQQPAWLCDQLATSAAALLASAFTQPCQDLIPCHIQCFLISCKQYDGYGHGLKEVATVAARLNHSISVMHPEELAAAATVNPRPVSSRPRTLQQTAETMRHCVSTPSNSSGRNTIATLANRMRCGHMACCGNNAGSCMAQQPAHHSLWSNCSNSAVLCSRVDCCLQDILRLKPANYSEALAAARAGLRVQVGCQGGYRGLHQK